MKTYFLGIDAGGSRCRALLADTEGHLLGQGHSASDSASLHISYGAGRSSQVIEKALREALAEFPGGRLLCMISHGSEETEGILRRLTASPFEIEHNGEYTAALALGETDAGYVSLSGTGAGSMAFLPGRKPMILDGLGPHAGDFGSGFWIGKKALEAVVRAKWAPGYSTALYEALNMFYLGKPDCSMGADYVPMLLTMPDRSRVAAAASLVNSCATEGDRTAIDILREAGRLLAETMRCLVKYHAPWPEPLPIFCTGSVINRSEIVSEAFDTACSEMLPEHSVTHLTRPQATGHLLCLAREQLSGEEFALFARNLKKQKELFS